MEHKFEYQPKGTCSVKMSFVLDDDDIIRDFSVLGGCNGNLKGVRALIIGMKAQDVVSRLSGIQCGFKKTSCPDQLSKGLATYLSQKEKN